MTNTLPNTAPLAKKSPFNLILGDLNRVRKSKGLWITVAVVGGIALLLLLIVAAIRFITGGTFGDPVLVLYSEIAILGTMSMLFPVMIIILVAMVSSDDYAFNTIRNKLVAGNSRLKVFFSLLVVNLIIFAILFIAFIVVLLPLAGLFFTFSGMHTILYRLAISLPIFIANVALATFISTAMKGRAGGIVINLVIQQVLPLAVMILASLMLIPALINAGEPNMALLYFIAYFELANPFTLLSFVLSPVIDLGYGLVLRPFAVTISPQQANTCILIPIVSAIFIGASIGFGYLRFHTKDFK